MAAPIATVGGLTLASRALGLIRDLLIAATLGAGPLADAFFLALRLPNLFRALFAEGAFSAAFVPVFAARLEREGPDAARAFGAAVASVLLVVLVPFTLLAEWLMPTVVAVLAPGFPETGERFQAALSLARVTFPYLALITMTAFFAAVLNAVFRFAAAAAAPLLLNLALIGALLFAAGWFETPAHALAWGVLVGGVAQLALVALVGGHLDVEGALARGHPLQGGTAREEAVKLHAGVVVLVEQRDSLAVAGPRGGAVAQRLGEDYRRAGAARYALDQ